MSKGTLSISYILNYCPLGRKDMGRHRKCWNEAGTGEGKIEANDDDVGLL
jgi:hypothetical protein